MKKASSSNKITKKALQQFVKRKLATDPDWAKRGLLRIYEFQTASEKESETTNVTNGVGFSSVDAEFLTSMARQLLHRQFLTEKQMTYLHKRISKYSRQVLSISDKDKLNKIYINYLQDTNGIFA